MPKEIQTPEPGVELKDAYGLKGRLRLALDEVIVPVHVLQAPSADINVVFNRQGLSGIPFVCFIPTTSSGAGAYKMAVVSQRLLFPSGDPTPTFFGGNRRILIESVQLHAAVADQTLNWGVGWSTQPTAWAQQTIGIKRDYGAAPVDYSQAASQAVPEVSMWSGQIGSGAMPPSVIMGGSNLFKAQGGHPGPVSQDIDIVLGRQRTKVTATGADWEGAAGGTAMTKGNAEFWVVYTELNDDMKIAVYGTLLDEPEGS